MQKLLRIQCGWCAPRQVETGVAAKVKRTSEAAPESDFAATISDYGFDGGIQAGLRTSRTGSRRHRNRMVSDSRADDSHSRCRDPDPGAKPTGYHCCACGS